MGISFTILPKEFSIHRFSIDSVIPGSIYKGEFYWIGKTDEELSVVCESSVYNGSNTSSDGWWVIKLLGPFKLNSVGIIAGISNLLANKKISIFALSTYDTDYILIQKENIQIAKDILVAAGYKYVKGE